MREIAPAAWRTLVQDARFRRGMADIWAFAPGIAAWGLVTGVAMVQSGLGLGLSLLMSITVFAGTAQLASLPLLAAGAPLWVICASALCVNLRFVIFSAQWRVHLGHLPRLQRLTLGYFLADLNLLVFQKAWPHRRREDGQIPYILGGATIWGVWQASSIAGIFAASLIPARWGLGFAGTLSMLGLAYGLLIDRRSRVAAGVAATAAIATYSLPLKLNILVAVAAAVAVGLLIRDGPGIPPQPRDAT